MHLVPPIIIALAKHPIVDKFDLSSVKTIISGAAPLAAETEKQLLERLKNSRLTLKQAYGMTELSPLSHYSPSDMSPRSGSVGLLIPNVEAKVLDLETGELLLPNQQGEICVRGPNVMLGYYGLTQETGATIDPDGFLHTGDIGYFDQDGYFFIVDRLKELIKYKGFQVAPAELEALLLEHPKIADSAVIPVPDEEAGEIPRAFVVLKPNCSMTEEEVKKYVADNVAPHKKLRGGVQFIAAVPKSSSGKILRRLLKSNPSKL